MPPTPSISVVTATFNALEGLRGTVQSLASQTFASVEHIIIDGGSTDGTHEFLESLGASVRWVSEPDEGIADAMNKGIAMASGEWVLFLHAGDRFIENGSLEKTIPHLDEGMMVGFAVEHLKADGTTRRLTPYPFSILTELRVINPHQGLFTRRILYEKVGYFDKRIPVGMDYDHLLRAKHAGYALKAVNELMSVMPADGVSSREDWASRFFRLNEQFRIQWSNAPNMAHKLMLIGFWCLFYPAYVVKNIIAPKIQTY